MDYEQGQFIINIIIAGFLGLVFGNFATNPIYRLPRKESLFIKDPYCGDCNAKLTAKDLFPVFSWLFTRGKCRYCGAAVSDIYPLTEAIVAVLFITYFMRYGFTERYLLVSFGMTALVMIAMMLYQDKFFSGKTAIAAIVFGLLYRALHDWTLYPALAGGFAGLIVGGVVWRLSGKEFVRDIAAFPSYLVLLVVAGVWIPLYQFPILCIMVAIISLFRKLRPWLVDWSIMLYIMLFMAMI